MPPSENVDREVMELIEEASALRLECERTREVASEARQSIREMRERCRVKQELLRPA